MRLRNLFMILLFGCAPAIAQVPDSQLDRWLSAAAAPALAERLRSHPRLAGASLEVAPLAAHQGDTPDALSQAVSQRLASLLRSQRGVHLASTGSGCAGPGRLLLLVDVQPAGSREHRVDLAFLDPASGHWLGGLGTHWEGRLARPAATALGQAALLPPDGSRTRPLPAAAHAAIAAALTERLGCVLARPHQWGAGIQPPTSGDAALLGALHRELGRLPGVATSDAPWRLQLVADTEHVIALAIAPQTGTAAPMELARVWLAPSANLPQRAVTTAAAPGRPVVPPQPDGLITGLTVSESDQRSGVCSNLARRERCLDVRLDLADKAYALLAWSQGAPDDRRIRVLGCGRTPERTEARQLRIADRGQLLGVYVLATDDRTAARQLGKLFADAPGACAGRPDEASRPGSTRAWLTNLHKTLVRLGGRVEWRLLHSGVPGSLLAEY